MRFSLIEIKTFLYILLTNFKVRPTEEEIIKANVWVCVHMEREDMLTAMQGADKAVHAGTIPGGKPVRAWGGAEIAGVGVTGVTY
jgi:hypothetical protein